MRRPRNVTSGEYHAAPAVHEQLGPSLWDRARRRLVAAWTPRTRQVVLFSGLATTGVSVGVVWGSWSRACAGAACPSIGVLEIYRPTQALKVYAADGRLIREVGAEHRTVLSVDEIAPAVRAAFIAVEDKRFYQHGGIDFYRVLGAVKANLLALGYAQGFSTITMQLARNVWSEKLPSTKSVRRKVREMRVALELERTYTKDRILELYLNQIYLGGSAYGVEAGARRYFSRSARDLNPAEAALLAAIANVPGHYDPRRYPGRALQRRNLVINLMRREGYLSRQHAEYWKAYPLAVSSRGDFGDVAPYFVEWVRQQLYARFGNDIYQQGFRVYTTLDLDLQLAAERALEDQLERIELGEYGPYRHLTLQEYLDREDADQKLVQTPYLQGALVTLDADSGYVRAMVGGRDFSHSEFNRASQAERQAGSTFKPFVYSAAIRAGRSAAYIIDDAPISLMVPGDTMPWEPQNYEGDFRGPMTLRDGLRLSRNLMAARLGLELGVPAVVGETVRYGLSTRLPNYPSVSIGSASVIPLEMVSAYTAFATLGVHSAPVGILRVEDAQGNIVWQPQVRRVRVMDAAHMWILNSLLQDVVNRGTASGALRVRGAFPHPAGGKTGTTNDGTDVWFIGFTSELVTGIWVGFDAPQKIKANAAGGLLAAPAWAQLMNEVYERRPAPAGWDRPDELITREIDTATGYRATNFCPREVRYWEWFIPGTEPSQLCPVHNPLNRFITGITTTEYRRSGDPP